MDPSLRRPTRGRTFTGRRRIRLADMDEHGRLRLDAVARFLQDVAIEDVSETGWGTPKHLWFIRRIRLEVVCPDSDPHIPSIVDVYPGNDWHERETWDMFGIVFDGHPALTRILMPDDWPGHPQRKDYPLGGIPVEYKGAQIPPPDQRRSYS